MRNVEFQMHDIETIYLGPWINVSIEGYPADEYIREIIIGNPPVNPAHVYWDMYSVEGRYTNGCGLSDKSPTILMGMIDKFISSGPVSCYSLTTDKKIQFIILDQERYEKLIALK